jgi:hypothetical protein
MTAAVATECDQVSEATWRRSRKRRASPLARLLGAKDTCDRCERPMVEHRERGHEWICIGCVELEREATDVCDRCERPMLEHRERGRERICIVCVELESAQRPQPIAPPEAAGCAAALRALLNELKYVSTTRAEARSAEQLTALVDTALGVAWWLTPPNLRVPGAARIDEPSVIRLLAAYEHTWGVRTAVHSLVGAFEQWRMMQLRAAQYAELAEVDRRYAALTNREAVVQEVRPPVRLESEQQNAAAAGAIVRRGTTQSLNLQRFERRAG